nr:TamF [uncultured bacterium]
MELLRGVGLEDRIRALDEGRESLILRVDTLAGTELERHSMGGHEEFGGLTPTPQVWCDQDQFEPILRARAEELGADVRFGVELVELTQDADQVRAVVRDRGTGEERVVVASYVLACDGAQSPLRERAGITLSGPGVLAHQAGILFRADLGPALRGRTFVLCLVAPLVESSDHLNILLSRNLNRWTLSVPYDPERGEDLDPRRCTELVRAATGLPDVAVEVLGVDRWPMRGLVSDRFRDGRVFLVGDAAHVLPPTGGFGGNSCVEDAHNIAWKLAAVLDGTAGPALLDTYEAERLPRARLLLGESLARAGLFLAGAAEGGSRQPQNHPSKASLVLGYRYGDGPLVEDPWQPPSGPGGRAPHLTVSVAGTEISTLDLFGRGFVLLTGARDWHTAASEVTGVTPYLVGPDAEVVAPSGRWESVYGVPPGGAVLVRPDGHIAWYGGPGPDRPAQAVRDALAAALHTQRAAVVPVR